MTLWKVLPFSRRVAFIYLIAISLLFLIHFKIANDFTYKHIKDYSDGRCRFGCFRKLEFYKLFSLNTHPAFYSRIYSGENDSDSQNEQRSSSQVDNGSIVFSNRQFVSVATPVSANGDGGDGFKPDVLYEPPKGETATRRYPQSVIIGFTKCGTRALIEFMSLHPYVRVARNEVHFYDKDENFELGYDWYREQMPLAYSDQVTVEKTPAYVLTQRARDEMSRLTPYVRLILLVRDPVVRLVSQYLLRFRLDDVNGQDSKPISAIYTNVSTGQFDPALRPVDIGNYQKHINIWLEKFSFHQMLIINSEDLTRNPLSVMKKVEKFLKLPSLFSEYNVYYNNTSGFFCPRGFQPSSPPRCLGKTKGLTHPKLSSKESSMLYQYYKPHNEKLFDLMGYRMNWTEKQWGKEED